MKHVVIIIVGGIIIIGASIGIIARGRLTEGDWKHYASPSLNVSFDYPQGWEVLDDDTDNVDPRLCPPEKDRIITRYLYANCITFFVGKSLWATNEMEGENPIYRQFADDINQHPDWPYVEYKKSTRNPVANDAAVDLIALYRNGTSDMIGLWQGVCAPHKQSQCTETFERVLASLRFNDGQ